MPMWHQEVKPSHEERALAESFADFAAQKFKIHKPEIRFVLEAAPSRDNYLYTHARAVGFVREGEIYVRAGLTPVRTAEIIVHEAVHLQQLSQARRDGHVSYSVECDERGARLAVYEIFADLPHNATYDETMQFVEKLKQKQSQQLRQKFAPILKQMSERYAARLQSGGLKIPGVLIEYR